MECIFLLFDLCFDAIIRRGSCDFVCQALEFGDSVGWVCSFYWFIFLFAFVSSVRARVNIAGIGGGEFRSLCVGICDSVELFVPLVSELSSAMVGSFLGYFSGSYESWNIVFVDRDYLHGDFHDGSVDCPADVRAGDGG